MGGNNTKITHFEWVNPITNGFIDSLSTEILIGIFNGCQDNINELQDSFDFGIRLIDNPLNTNKDKEDLLSYMRHFKKLGDYDVNNIIKNKPWSNEAVESCKKLNTHTGRVLNMFKAKGMTT